jgi:hypothetical protein
MNETVLRRLIEQSFSREELEGLCADIEQRLRDAGQNYPVDLDTVGGANKPAQVLNLLEYLKRRGHLEHLVAAVEAARPGLLAELPKDSGGAAAALADGAAPAADDQQPPAAPQTMQGFVAAAGLASTAAHVLVGCVVLEEPARLRELVAGAREDLLHDPALRGKPAVEALRKRPFDYGSDDVEVKSRFLDLLTRLTFEAYAYFAPKTTGGSSDDELFARISSRLLSDRFTNERKRRFELWLDRRLEARLPRASAIVERAVASLNKEGRGVAGASIALAAPQEPAIAVANYVCEIAHRKIEGGTELEQRAFERLHPRKIRLIHELGTNRFFRGNRPLR